MPAVYFPILVMLLGLLFRGVAFEFRHVPQARLAVWDRAFAYGSLLATFAQGVVLGNFIEGFPVSGRSFSGTSWDWIGPFPLFTGVGLIVGYSLLGATWLYMKTEGALQQWAKSMSYKALMGILVFIVVVSVWTPLASERIAERWFTLPNFIYFMPVPILTAVLAWLIWHALNQGRDVLPFMGTMGLFFLSFTGLIISLWPYVAPPSVTLWDAATAPMSQQFLMVGTMFLLPVILLYVFWSYWVFRGKVRADTGYHQH